MYNTHIKLRRSTSPAIMPRVKTIRNPTPTQTRRLVSGYNHMRLQESAPYRSIKICQCQYDRTVCRRRNYQECLRFGIHEGSYVQDGAFFKLKLKRLGLNRPAPLGLSRKASTVPTVRHKAPTRTVGVKSLHGCRR